ncbi:MAG TPA: bifunctional DNA primase/polymerase [Aggregatilineaceae bacterium]|nr:bifunctional DNA primase/polymerase [Aggregatilineaceae bacterium]
MSNTVNSLTSNYHPGNKPAISLLNAAYFFHEKLGRPIIFHDRKKPCHPYAEIISQTKADLRALAYQAKKASGVAVLLGGDLVCVDFDKQPNRTALDHFLAALNLSLDYEWIVKTPGGGWHVYLRAASLDLGARKWDRAGLHGQYDEKGQVDTHFEHVELRYDRILATLPPSLHPSGKRYQFAGERPSFPPVSIDPDRLIAAYEKITQKPPEKPEYNYRLLKEVDNPNSISSASELEEIERRTRLAIAAALGKRGNKLGYYTCPFDHGHEGKDFLFSPEPGQPIGGCQGKHAGQLTRWVDLADHLGIDVSQIARDVASERRPVLETSYMGGNLIQAGENTPRRFPLGLPYVLNRRLMNAHKKIAVDRQHAAALIWYLWHEIPQLIQDDQAFTAGELIAALAHIGRNTSRDTVEKALEQLVYWRVVEICDICDLHTQNNIHISVANSANLRKRTKPGKLYRFLPIERQVANFQTHWGYLLREATYQQIPADVQAEFGDLDTDELAALTDYRADLYAEHEPAREKAAASLQLGIESLARGVKNILAGRYRPVAKLPSGEIKNARQYCDLVYKAQLQEVGGEREKAYEAQFEIGVSRSTLARMRDRVGVITVERSKVLAADLITDYQRDNGFIIEEYQDGSAKVRMASAEKLIERASEGEKAAYDRRCELQKARRALQDSRLRQLTSLKAAPAYQPSEKPTAPKADLPLFIPEAYSDSFVRDQAFMKWPENLPHFDSQTGEILTPKQLWRALADHLLGRAESEAETISTYTVHAEPREHTHQAVDTLAARESERDTRVRMSEQPNTISRRAVAVLDQPAQTELPYRLDSAGQVVKKAVCCHCGTVTPSGFWCSDHDTLAKRVRPLCC